MAAPEIETVQKKTTPKISSWDILLAFKEKFANETPTQDSALALIKEKFNVESFRELGYGNKWKSVTYPYRPHVHWAEDGSLTFPSEEQVDTVLRKQIEFYFSDGNLPRDNFLQNALNKETNPDQWVDIEVLLKFKRVKMYTQDVSSIARILSTSETLDVNSDNTKLRRKIPCTLTENDLNERSASMSGFALKTKEAELRATLASHGTILSIFRKKRYKKACIWNVFWSTVEECEQFVDLKTIEHDDLTIKISRGNQEVIVEKKKEAGKEISFKHVLFISGMPEQTSFGEVKDYLRNSGVVAFYVKMSNAEKTEAYVRLNETGDIEAEVAVEKLKGQQLNDQDVTVAVIPKDDWARVSEILRPASKRKFEVGNRRNNHKRQRTR